MAFKILSLFSAMASVTCDKLSALIAASLFSRRLIFLIRSAIISSPDPLGRHNPILPIFCQHVRCTVDFLFDYESWLD